MRFQSGRARMVVEILSPTEKKVSYEILQPPRAWRPMPWTMAQKFGRAKLRWTIKLEIEHKDSEQVVEVDVNTPTVITEASSVTKQLLDAALEEGGLEVYGAVVTVSVK